MSTTVSRSRSSPGRIDDGRGGCDLAGLAQEGERVVAGERRLSRQSLVENHAQAVHVGRDGQVLPPGGLLGSHVLRRAQHLAGLGERTVAGGQPLRQAEVGDEQSSLGINEHVGGLQVAVQDAALVGVVHGPDHVDHALDLRARIAPGVLRQRGPLDELHRVVLLAFMLADLVDRHDVGMVEVGRRLGLGAEPLDVRLEAKLPARIILRATSRLSDTCRAL